jgi:Probable sensor domain DACNV
MNELLSPDDPFVVAIHDQLAPLAKINEGMSRAFASRMPTLTREHLSSLIEVAFWAGLGSDEGRTTRVGIALASPESFADAFKLPAVVPYDSSHITKLAPAVPQDGCLLVSESNGGLGIWGIGRSRPIGDTVTIEIFRPGTMQVGLGPFGTFAVLNGQSRWILGSTGIHLAADLQRVLQKKLPTDDIIETQAVWRESLALVELARMVVATGHGGIILIVPSETGDWENTLSPFEYRFEAPDTTIRDAIRAPLRAISDQSRIIHELSQATVSNEAKEFIFRNLSVQESVWRQRQSGLTRATASLAGVDGALVMTQDLRLLGFGAKIVPSEDVKQVYIVDLPYSGNAGPSPLEKVGGTRHQSSARFAAANKDAAALVISQDRHVSLMFWDPQSNSVVVRRNVQWLM